MGRIRPATPRPRSTATAARRTRRGQFSTDRFQRRLAAGILPASTSVEDRIFRTEEKCPPSMPTAGANFADVAERYGCGGLVVSVVTVTLLTVGWEAPGVV